MADIIGVHALEATGGRTYAEMGRFLTPDGDDTSDETAALKDENGNPIANPLRHVAFQASALQTSLDTSHMAFNVADLVIGLGVFIAVVGVVIGGIGVALGALAIPRLARTFRIEPVLTRAAACRVLGTALERRPANESGAAPHPGALVGYPRA